MANRSGTGGSSLVIALGAEQDYSLADALLVISFWRWPLAFDVPYGQRGT